MMSQVTTLNESHQYLLNDDDTKPKRWKLNKKNQNDRFFIDWGLRLYHNRELLDSTIDWIIESKDTKLQARSIPAFRKLCEVILLNLGKSLIQRRWMQLPKRDIDYSKGTEPHTFGFTKRHVNQIQKILFENELIYVIKGAKYKDDPQITAYQPTELFDSRLAILSLSSVSTFAIEYVRINGQAAPLSERDQVQVEEDRRKLTIINNFLCEHNYPLKGPMTRIYSKKVGSSGRIYCEFQAISSRKVAIRQHSLIDGEEIVEVDIRSSHPRIAVQEYHQENLSPTFYSDVEKETGIFRDKVKKFFQFALSSKSLSAAKGAFVKEGYDTADFNTLKDWTVNKYPDLPLFQLWSLEAMNHEGTIILNVMMRGVEEGIVVLPIHDAIAVKKRDEQWAINTLKDEWYRHFGYDFCEVSSK